MKKLFFIGVLLCSFSVISAKSNENYEMPVSFGIYGGLNINMHNPSFKFEPKLKDFRITNEIHFNENATGLGFNAGGILNVPINDYFVFSGRVGYNLLNGTLKSGTELRSGDTIYKADNLVGNLSYLEITPAIQIHNLLPLKRLYFLAGLELGVPLSEEYEYTEVRSFVNQSLSISKTETEPIDKKELRLALAFGVGYVFNLSESFLLIPEVSYRLPFTKVSGENRFDSWEVPQIRAGLSLMFGFPKRESRKKDDDISFLNVGFREVNYYDREGKKKSLDKVTVEEIQYKELFPLVSYVFFSQSESRPLTEYQTNSNRQAGEFTMTELEANAHTINKNTLDIIGVRMRENPRANLTISGTNDDMNEARNMELSQRRADYAKDYLVKNYGIDANRITTRAVGLPQKASTKRDLDGVIENRRVEFASNDNKILYPITIAGDKEAIPTPDNVEFVTFAETSDPIDKWEIEIYQSDRLLKKFEGKGEPEPVRWFIAPNVLSPGAIPLEYTFSARNTKGMKKIASGSIPVEFVSFTRKKAENRPDQTISKFSLILFDFDSDVINIMDRKIIDDEIIPEIKFNSTIKIYGYTDRIGTESYNKQLALRRANQVRDALKTKVPSAKYEVFGVGEDHKIFDNDSPIGRHLSRTVQVYVITPKN